MKSIDKTLVLFEFKDEIDSFLLQRSIGELRDTNTYILALLPEAQAHLKRMDIRFFNTYSFFHGYIITKLPRRLYKKQVIIQLEK